MMRQSRAYRRAHDEQHGEGQARERFWDILYGLAVGEGIQLLLKYGVIRITIVYNFNWS